MIEIDLGVIKIPFLWGEEKSFSKKDWGDINLIVGPNGTGKTILAEHIRSILIKKGYKTRILSAERLSGLEKQQNNTMGYSQIADGFNISQYQSYKNQGDQFGLSAPAFVTLKERIDIRIKVEALLSDIFKKTIRLKEEGGFMKPKIQNLNGNEEYGLKEQECHGLKEIITLFTFLYSDQYECLIFDEPELHLHPQYQSFFLSEIRKIAGDPKANPSKKLFFIITHSPYYLDFRTIDDLKSLLVCHFFKPPTYIDILEPEDEWRLKKFLPRFNTHHKQFFFSPNPVFVEGYTDQQVITLLYDKLEKNIGASGSCVIDVGGKDELDVFYRICKQLNLDARFIADLDTLFSGKLRQTVSSDERALKFVQDHGIGPNVANQIGDIETRLKTIVDDLIIKTTNDQDLKELIDNLKSIPDIPEELHKSRYSMLLGIIHHKDKISEFISSGLSGDVNFIFGRVSKLIDAFATCNVFILPEGEIENYFKKTVINYLSISNKDRLFETERDYLLTCSDKAEIQANYPELINILNKSVPEVQIDLKSHLKFVIVEWIQVVQRGVARGEITDNNTLKTNSKTEYKLYNQIIDALDLKVEPDKKFTCKIKFQDLLIKPNAELIFNEKTIPYDFKLD